MLARYEWCYWFDGNGGNESEGWCRKEFAVQVGGDEGSAMIIYYIIDMQSFRTFNPYTKQLVR